MLRLGLLLLALANAAPPKRASLPRRQAKARRWSAMHGNATLLCFVHVRRPTRE